jgi:hypothetical protein
MKHKMLIILFCLASLVACQKSTAANTDAGDKASPAAEKNPGGGPGRDVSNPPDSKVLSLENIAQVKAVSGSGPLDVAMTILQLKEETKVTQKILNKALDQKLTIKCSTKCLIQSKEL